MFKVPIYKCMKCGEEHVGVQISDEKIEFICNDGYRYYKPILNPMIVWKKLKKESSK